MDTVLEFLDDHLLDGIYSKIFPAANELNGTATLTPVFHRDNDIRISLSIFAFVTISALFFYFSTACFSYYVLFDHESEKHPKFLRNQVRLEIECAVKAIPIMSCM